MGMKEKTKKRIQGSISVLLVIILLPMMTFSAIIVDICRINMAKQMMSSAGDLTMNTALTNYDTILKDVYGLFAMSQTEGLTNDQLGEKLNKYFAKTLSSYGVVPEENAEDYVGSLIGDFREILADATAGTTNFLELTNIDLTAAPVEGSSLAKASVLRKQIVEYMKYRAPMGVGLSFLDSLTSFKKMDAQKAVVTAQVAAQESTQDVTKACQTLIQLIRDYDKHADNINKTLTGATHSADATVILLEDYDSHVLKYLGSWGTKNVPENYTHINKLTCVFLANAPSADSVYLKELAYGSGERYIKMDSSIYNGDKAGFTADVTPSGDLAEALANVNAQAEKLNSADYQNLAKQYTQPMLPAKLLTYNAVNIDKATISNANEDEAINSFIKFEKFLLDQTENNGITYTKLQDVLKQIANLEKYRGYYIQKVDAAIQQAEKEQQAAQNTLDALNKSRDDAEGAMADAITAINNNLSAFMQGQTGQISPVLNQLPACSEDYSSYYSTNIQAGTNDNKYIEAFRQLVNGPLAKFGTANQKKVISEAKSYIAQSNYNPDGFEQHMKDKCSAQENDIVFKYLCCMMKCHSQAIKYQSNISKYSDAVAQIPEAQQTLRTAQQKVFDLKDQKQDTQTLVTTCAKGYYDFCESYQADAYYYKYYINAAKNTVGPEAQKIQTHFSKLLGYLKELYDDMLAIEKQIGLVEEAIETYNSNLESWNKANEKYSKDNGSDSFSEQSAGDINKARTEYDTTIYEALSNFVEVMRKEFENLYLKLSGESNFVYGSMRIDTIKTADDLINAISKESFSEVVTVEEATQKLTTLYKGETIEYVPYTMDYSKQLGFLSPEIVQLQALKYLNSTYPDSAMLSDEDKQANTNTKKEYEATKDKLTGTNKTVEESADKKGDDEDVDKEVNAEGFGYTYESNKVGTKLPSEKQKTDKQTKTESQYQITTSGEGDEERLNASESLSTQNDNSGSFLSKLGNIATTAVENLYILNYIFENFSYNTIVQDQINEEVKLTKTSLLGQMGEAATNFGKAENVTAAKKMTTTLSNFAISEKNNHLYGAEIEYILFGNSDPSANVTTANAIIYAIRFGFNCIFAFTDSEIRNSTMAAGLAVQAATLGIVPYQVVQIVLQLALAAAEAAIDLSAMNHGLSVAIVKTRDTWSLSLSGGSAALKDVGNAAAQMLTDKITDGTTTAIKSVTNGLNDLLDAGADELKTAIEGVSDSLQSTAQGALEDVMDKVLSTVMAEIEKGLNELPYVSIGKDEDGMDEPVTKEAVQAKADSIFLGVRIKLDVIISEACNGNQMAMTLAEDLKIFADQMVTDMETEVTNVINDAGEVDVTAYISSHLNSLKKQLVEKGNQFISDILGTVEEKARSAVAVTKGKLEDYINQCGEELTEQAADLIKENVTSLTNSFVETTLKVSPSSSSVSTGKSSPMSMFKFGYKDYLMLMTYISICCGDSVLLRTADVIQMNLQRTSADFSHKANSEDGKKKFMMDEAYTYIWVEGTAELDMFFMDMSIFSSQVAEETVTADGTEGAVAVEDAENGKGTKIIYQGLLGY